jgi:hypothetical protein
LASCNAAKNAATTAMAPEADFTIQIGRVRFSGRSRLRRVAPTVLESQFSSRQRLPASKFAALNGEKSPGLKTVRMRRNPKDISKAHFQLGMWEFDPFVVSQAFPRSTGLPERPATVIFNLQIMMCRS